MSARNETNSQITNNTTEIPEVSGTTPETHTDSPRQLTPREKENARSCARANPAIASVMPRMLATAVASAGDWSMENVWHAMFTRDLSLEENAQMTMKFVLMTGMIMPDQVTQEEADDLGLTTEDIDRLMEEFTQSERAMENSVMIINGLAYQFTKLLGALVDADDDTRRKTFAHVMQDKELMNRFIVDGIPTMAQALLLERKGVEWRGHSASVMENCLEKLMIAKALTDLEIAQEQEDE